MSYQRLFWFTLSSFEWWVRLRKDTCHLPVFLLCVPISLLASKCLVRQLPTPGIVIHFSQTVPPQLHPKISIVCLSTSKRVKILQKAPSTNIKFRKDMELSSLKKKCPWSLAKMVQKKGFNKMNQKCFQKCESISPSPLNISDSLRLKFDEVPTSCEPLFGSATQVIKICRTLPTHNSRYQS
jgi:hypothetical protein